MWTLTLLAGCSGTLEMAEDKVNPALLTSTGFAARPTDKPQAFVRESRPGGPGTFPNINDVPQGPARPLLTAAERAAVEAELARLKAENDRIGQAARQ